MPRLDPFSALCRQVSRRPALDRADLHLHTTFSDGTYTPAQVVELALRVGLCAIAVTDHDTLDGVEPARRAAEGTGLEIVSAVEITAEYAQREIHLLGYFVDAKSHQLGEALGRVRAARVGRFHEMIERLRGLGIEINAPAADVGGVLGRRHLAELLVRAGRVGTMREAFRRYLHDGAPVNVPKQRLPFEEALACVRAAGGVSSWAHPPENVPPEQVREMRALGLDALEADYPGFRAGRVKRLKEMALELGMVTTGGSDCHGPDSPGRAVGAVTIAREALDALRAYQNRKPV